MAKQNGTLIRYLPCRVEPGMFRGEWLVYLTGFRLENPSNAIKIQMLVDQRDVFGLKGEPKRNSPIAGWVKVSFAGEQGDLAKVILPQPAQPVGESMLVNQSDLRTKPGG